MKKDIDKPMEAVALTYDKETQSAPKVIAKGRATTAENIIKLAKENSIPIQEDPSLVELLSKLNINEQIPEELYKAVSEIFAFIYRMDRNIDSYK